MLRPHANTTSSGAERRRERRYQVDLSGVARCTSEGREVVIPVAVSDLSASGALIEAKSRGESFSLGAVITLVVDAFGAIEARVAHVGHGFYGLSFLHPHRHRDRLAAWLREDVGSCY